MYSKKSRMSFLNFSLVLVLSASMLLTGCGKSVKTETTTANKETTAKAAELQTINVAYMPDLHGAAPIVIGEEKGYFKDAGLKINAVKFLSGPPEFQAMASGTIDIAYIGPGATFLAAQGQGVIVAVDSLNTGDMVLTTKKSGIKEIKDLVGKKVGVPKGTSGEMVLNLALEKNGIKPEQLEILNMDVAGAVAAFVANKIDAVAIWSPYTGTIEKQLGKDNVVVLSSNKDFAPEYVFPQSWVVNPKFLKEKPELVQKFVAAWLKANDYRIENIDDTIKLTANFTQIPEEDLKIQNTTTEWLTRDKIKEAFNGPVNSWFENLEKLFVKNGKLPSVVKGSEFINKDIIMKEIDIK